MMGPYVGVAAVLLFVWIAIAVKRLPVDAARGADDRPQAFAPALARLLGVPYIPITPTFPLLGPLGLVPLPSKWLLEFGEPIRTDEYDEGAADDPMHVFNVTDQVRETIQQTLYTLLMERESVFR